MTLPPSDAAGSKAEPVDPAKADRAIDRKLLAEIFGDVLPQTTGDERGSGSPDGAYTEEWYRENRPPHHGG